MAERESAFGGKGRPSPEESERRKQTFLSLVVRGVDLDEAAKQSRIQPLRALAILNPIVQQLLVEKAA